MRELLTHGLRANELERAKTAVLGGIKLGLDSPSNRMNRLARSLIRTGKFTPFSVIEKELSLIKASEIMEVVEELFLQGKWAAGAVIPKESAKLNLEPLLDFS